MIWGFGDVSRLPKTNIIYLWRHQDAYKNQENPWSNFEKYYFCKYENQHFRKCMIYEVSFVFFTLSTPLVIIKEDEDREMMKIGEIKSTRAWI